MTRKSHWVKPNHQCRIPPRWVAFDTESFRTKYDKTEIQTWRLGAGIRWREDLKRGYAEEEAVFDNPLDFWKWVTEFCRPGKRTVAIAHNLSFDVRISGALNILPTLGWHLDWCNLDRNVSAMTWRGPNGTLVLCDLFTWIPKPLYEIGKLCDMAKLSMPNMQDTSSVWGSYCLRDARIVATAKRRILRWIRDEDLGNWQPTGAGFSYSTWRHRFMPHKVLVHDNFGVLNDERRAMHTGRAEAWRHGVLSHDTWYEVDLRNAYTRIAAECDMPTKYKFSTGAITQSQYEDLSERFRLLCVVNVSTDEPVAPFYSGQRTIWPIGQFQTTLWDVEIDNILGCGGMVDIRKAHIYTKSPCLSGWASWILDTQSRSSELIEPVIKAYAKHAGRALIGRLALKAPEWEIYGGNPAGFTGISYEVDSASGAVTRQMHVGEITLSETARNEGRDSLPQITGWIAAECRVRLWHAMLASGLDQVAHVDTDSVLVSKQGLQNMRVTYGMQFRQLWQIKRQFSSLDIYGPRCYRAGRKRTAAGIPLKAVEIERDTFTGETWHGMGKDMEDGRAGAVTVTEGRWTMKRSDPRRREAEGDASRTVAIRVGD